MRIKSYGYFLLAVIAGLVVLLILRDSEAEKILRQLENIRALTEVNAPESTIVQAGKASRISQAFSEQTRYDLTNLGHGIIKIDSRQELTGKILRGRAALASLELALDHPLVHIDGNQARVELQGSATGSSRNAEGQFLDIHRLEVMLEKNPDGWLITGARHISDERQPP